MCGQDSEPLGQMTQAGREWRGGRESGGREGERERGGREGERERGKALVTNMTKEALGEWFNGAVFGAVIIT